MKTIKIKDKEFKIVDSYTYKIGDTIYKDIFIMNEDNEKENVKTLTLKDGDLYLETYYEGDIVSFLTSLAGEAIGEERDLHMNSGIEGEVEDGVLYSYEGGERDQGIPLSPTKETITELFSHELSEKEIASINPKNYTEIVDYIKNSEIYYQGINEDEDDTEDDTEDEDKRKTARIKYVTFWIGNGEGVIRYYEKKLLTEKDSSIIKGLKLKIKESNDEVNDYKKELEELESH